MGECTGTRFGCCLLESVGTQELEKRHISQKSGNPLEYLLVGKSFLVQVNGFCSLHI